MLMKKNLLRGLFVGIALAAGSSAALAADSVPESSRANFADSQTVQLPEGYRQWVHVGTYLKEPGSTTILDGSKIEGAQFGNTYVEPKAFAAFKATGKWPDGTQIVKEFSASGFSEGCDKGSGVCTTNQGKPWPQDMDSCDKATGVCSTKHGKGIFQQYYFGAGYMVKDAARFPKAAGNWGYFSFGPAKDKPYPATAKLRPVEQCAGCHIANRADKDYVFSDLHLDLQ